MRARATRVGRDTFLSQMVRIVREAQAGKIPVQAFADKVTSVFVPFVLVLAVATFVAWLALPETLRSVAAWAANGLPWVRVEGVTQWSLAALAAISVLVIACPCAMGLATPTALMVGTGWGAEHGILIRHGEAIQALRNVRAVVFDKTGTLTHGRPSVTDVVPAPGCREDNLLQLAGAVERYSEHPVAQAITARCGESPYHAKDFHADPGMGAQAMVSGQLVRVGKAGYLADAGVDTGSLREAITRLEAEGKSVVAVSADARMMGVMAVADTVKDNAVEVIAQLKRMGLVVAMITGDHEKTASAVARQLGIERVMADVLPDGKAEAIAALQRDTGPVAMVGDGINDAAALVQAAVGIAIGTGTDIAIESADVTLVRGNLARVTAAVRLSRATFQKIRQNLFWAFAYNMLSMPLAMLGLLHPLIAEAAMAFSSVNVVTNSLRLRSAMAKVQGETT